jgi:L-2-hydroxycarboxylate dehydrogenase (NAD+)
MARGFTEEEAKYAAKTATMASRHGIRTHNILKAVHLDDHLGSCKTCDGSNPEKKQRTDKIGCVPGAVIEKLPTKYKAFERWNCNRKLGQAVAWEAMETCMKLADEYGVGCVAVDNAFHYLWGGGYVMEAAKKGYIAYTCCPAALTEVVPFGGKAPTLGTNPHSWGLPTQDAVGYPIVVDWATSVVAMGRVQQLKREGKQLPNCAGVDKDGKYTTDPNQVVALVPFGAHKGYGLALIDEIYAAFTGGSTPTIRNRWDQSPPTGEKQTCTFYFQCQKADAFSCGNFAQGRTQAENVKAVLADVLGHGNDGCMLPGTVEANSAKLCEEHGGLLFSDAEMAELAGLAKTHDVAFDPTSYKQVEVPDPFAMAMAAKKKDIKILLTTTSYQDTPGEHHTMLENSGFEVVRARGPLPAADMLKLVQEHGGFDGFLNGDDEIDATVLDAALSAKRQLKVVAKYGIGLDSIDVAHCTSKKLPVCFTPGVNHTTVAEHAMGLIIGCAKHFWLHTSSVKSGQWKRKTGIELAGKTLGIVGMGRIGKELIKRCAACDMKAIAFDVYWDEKFAKEHGVQRATTKEEVLKSADVISLHTNLDDSTREMINAASIATMKPTAILINTARGGLVNEADVADACKNGKLYAYGADVLCHEPMKAPHPFQEVDNVFLTPHVASRTGESVQRQACRATLNLVQFLTGGKDFIQANKF